MSTVELLTLMMDVLYIIMMHPVHLKSEAFDYRVAVWSRV